MSKSTNLKNLLTSTTNFIHNTTKTGMTRLIIFSILLCITQPNLYSQNSITKNVVKRDISVLPKVDDIIINSAKIMRYKLTDRVFKDNLGISQRLWLDSDGEMYYPRIKGCEVEFWPMSMFEIWWD